MFDSIVVDRESRVYCPDERDSDEFVRINSFMGISRGAYRNWEYAAAMKALGDMRGKKVLSVGAYHCSLSRFLSHHASELVACDRHLADIVEWGNIHGGWGRATQLVEGDFSEIGTQYPDGYFDAVVSIGAIEHTSGSPDGEPNTPGDGDSRTMAQIGRVLAPDGVAAVTTEWSYLHRYDPDFVGGWVYDTSALFHRLVEPSGLECRYDPEKGHRFLVRSVSWKRCIEDFPAIGQHEHPLCPCLLVLTHPEPRQSKRGR
jgi:SAM-dependent methyltransferase